MGLDARLAVPPPAPSRETLGKLAALLERQGISIDEIGKLSRVSVYQSLTKNEDGEAEIHDLLGVQFSPAWEQGPAWDTVRQGPASKVTVRLPKPEAKPVGYETAVILPDMITLPGQRGSRCLAQCIKAYEEHGGNIIAVEEVPPSETHLYGVVSVARDFGHTFEIGGMVEKPPQGTAPSNLIISGRYVLEPQIFDILEKVEKGAGGEIQLTDGMKALATKQPFFGVRFDGKTYDTGSKVGFLAANVAFALSRPDIAPAFRAELKKIVGSL